MSSKQTTISARLRQAIQDSGMSFLALEKNTGVLRQSLMKFVRGEQAIHLDAADSLAEYFGLELQPQKKRPSKKQPAGDR